MSALPTPPLLAQQHSLKLQNLLRARIKQEGKISFAEFMHMALYEPQLGYYVAGSHKLGDKGDFITAPEVSDLFGMTIAKFFLQHNPNLVKKAWLELGAGSGKLCASILNFLATQSALPHNYFICEISPDLIERQKMFLQQNLPSEIFQRISWLSELPKKFSGIMVGNEILDALPCERFQVTEEGIKTFFVSVDAQDQFRFLLDFPNHSKLTERLTALQEKFQLPIGYCSEINIQQEALLKSLNDHLQEGYILLIDYGYPAKLFYHPDRIAGTFRCHYQQRAHEDVFLWPGLQDITAHIDFTALARCGIEQGLSLIYYGHQGSWLIENGILNLGVLPDKIGLQLTNAIQTLVSPNAMGENFKVLLFGKDTTLINAETLHSNRRFDL